MSLFTREDLRELLAPHLRPCVTLLMPTHRRPPESQQDPIRFKNLVRAAARRLEERSLAAEAAALLDPVEALADSWFWRHQLDGLAVFRSHDLLREVRLPLVLPEQVVVADSFHVKPLLRYLQADQRFYVLCLSQASVSLHVGSPFTLGPVAPTSLPGSLREALGAESAQAFVKGGGGGGPALHGRGTPEPAKKDELLRFFRVVDRALVQALRGEEAPLVLAGVGYALPIYREASRYAHLAATGVEGNFDAASPEELHARAWPVARELLAAREAAALAEWTAAVSRSLATDDLEAVARHAIRGRVRRLLLAEGAQAFGRLDAESGELRLTGAQESLHEDDVLDDLAEAVLLRGGEVLVVPPARMPSPSPAAALLRW